MDAALYTFLNFRDYILTKINNERPIWDQNCCDDSKMCCHAYKRKTWNYDIVIYFETDNNYIIWLVEMNR